MNILTINACGCYYVCNECGQSPHNGLVSVQPARTTPEEQLETSSSSALPSREVCTLINQRQNTGQSSQTERRGKLLTGIRHAGFGLWRTGSGAGVELFLVLWCWLGWSGIGKSTLLPGLESIGSTVPHPLCMWGRIRSASERASRLGLLMLG